jgi:hypothetical protein
MDLGLILGDRVTTEVDKGVCNTKTVGGRL